MKTAIITDTTVYVENEFIIQNNIFRIPLMVNFENITYKESDTDSSILKSIMTRVNEEKVLPKTSQPSTQDFLNKFEEVKELGYERILLFTLSSNLSGTYQGAVLAANTFNETNADMVEVFDTKNAAMGSTFIVREVVRYMHEVDEDIKHETINEIVNFYAEHAKVYLAVDTLNYLSYGGRISPAMAAAGNLFGIKPLLLVTAGKIEEYGKARSSKKVLKMILDDYEKSPITTGYLSVGHCMNEREANSLNKHLSSLKPEVDVMPIVEIGPVIATHTGPGTIAAVWAPKFF